jgi:hypothetical protein
MRNVQEAQVNIVLSTQEHASELAQDTNHKFGGRERKDASRRPCTSSMVLVKGKQPALLSGASLTFPFALLCSPKRSFTTTCICHLRL